MDSTNERHSTALFILYLLFFLSGSAALIYQIMWQRMLFTLFGVDLEAVTIIISVFMFGLGIGGIAGGILADKMPGRLLLFYVIIEISIAGFGYFSPALIDSIGNLPLDNKLIITLFSFILLAVPTFLMGATFPILVIHVNQFHKHIGKSVGGLYFSNTLGGAIGAYLSGFILLYLTDLVGAIQSAAAINIFIAMTALLLLRRKQ